MNKFVFLSIYLFLYLLPFNTKAQSLYIGYGQASTRSTMPIPLVGGPTKACHQGANFFYITGTYPWKKWELIASYRANNAGVALGVEDGWYSYVAAQDMRVNSFEIGAGYHIFPRYSRLYALPFASVGVQNIHTIHPNNDFDAFWPVITPKYKQISSEVEFFEGTQLSASLGLQLGIRFGKSRRFSFNVNMQYLYAPKTIESIHFNYWSPPNPYDSLYARADGTTTGFYKSISIGYTIPFKKKKKKTVEKESLYYYEDKKLNITD